VFSFPVAAPEGAITRKDISAIDHLELWKTYQDEYCEHKPSVTINVKEDEWLDVGAWVFRNFDSISGVSFLPYSDHTYKQAPYIEISKEEYAEWASKMPTSLDWSTMVENEDTTTSSQELACGGRESCEIL
jgi:ribonucleoside-diphosphate reductase alpha chain